MASDVQSPSSRLRLLNERPAEDQLEPLSPPEAAAAPSKPSNENYHGAMLATFATIAKVLNARILLLLAVIGAFVLTLIAVLDPTQLRLLTALTFDVCVLVPLVVLYAMKG